MKLAMILLLSAVAMGQDKPKPCTIKQTNPHHVGEPPYNYIHAHSADDDVPCFQLPDKNICETGEGGYATMTIPVQHPGWVAYASDDKSITIEAKDSSIVRLPLIEYDHLQALRKAVTDEEERLAVKYGADKGELVRPPCPPQYRACGQVPEWKPRKPDHYEFHGRFLLIEKAK